LLKAFFVLATLGALVVFLATVRCFARATLTSLLETPDATIPDDNKVLRVKIVDVAVAHNRVSTVATIHMRRRFEFRASCLDLIPVVEMTRNVATVILVIIQLCHNLLVSL
jgi:hypothetical protein